MSSSNTSSSKARRGRHHHAQPPEMLNALSFGVFREIAAAVDDSKPMTDRMHSFDAARRPSPPARYQEMQPKTFIDMFSSDFMRSAAPRRQLPQTTLAAVSGYALGGGCELAMMRLIIARTPQIRAAGNPSAHPGIGGTSG